MKIKPQYFAAPATSMLSDLAMTECRDLHTHGDYMPGALDVSNCSAFGKATAIDSLAAVKHLIFDTKRLTWDQLLTAIEANWEGHEAVRQLCLNAPKYGNGIEWVDAIGLEMETRLLEFLHDHPKPHNQPFVMRQIPITFHVPMGKVTWATPNGRPAHEYLSEGISASHGMDAKGPTVSLASMARARNLSFREKEGDLINLKFSPATVAGEEGTRRLMQIVRTWCDLKHWHVQFNILNSETLLAAQQDPEKYRSLIVRIAGYSAYFVDCPPSSSWRSSLVRKRKCSKRWMGDPFGPHLRKLPTHKSEETDMELKGKTAIVTGSGRGIGEGIALVLAREGASLVINDRKITQDAEGVVKKIDAMGGKAIAVGADISKKAEVTALAAETIKQFGAIDILVNNAGIESHPVLTMELAEETWDRVLNVNLKGTFLCCQAVIPQMMKQNKGRIINIGSTASIRIAFFGGVEYTASKHGQAGLSRHLAWELADSNITVNTVCPGAVQTPLMEQGTTPEYREMTVKRLIPLGRFCTIEDIGETVSFLASDRAAMITGQMIPVDGGALTGFGEDLRAVVRKRMTDLKAAAGH